MVVTLKVLIGAVPTCMILTGLCILMAGPAPKVPSQDPSRRLSLQRWAPRARGHTQGTHTQGSTDMQRCETNGSAVLSEHSHSPTLPPFRLFLQLQ